jgi:hypothetical protein
MYEEIMIRYFKRVCSALSVLLNVILGGEDDQKFAARNYEWKRLGKPNMVFLIDLIFWYNPDHSMQVWTYWITRKETL